MSDRPSPREIATAIEVLRQRLDVLREDFRADQQRVRHVEQSLEDLLAALAALRQARESGPHERPAGSSPLLHTGEGKQSCEEGTDAGSRPTAG